MNTVVHQGRRVTKAWYSRFVLKNTGKRATQDRRILVNFHMPKIEGYCDAETRLVNMNSINSRGWVYELNRLYALPRTGELTTFFPTHP